LSDSSGSGTSQPPPVSGEAAEESPLWAVPAFAAWVVVFGIGLVPETTFQALRDMSGVLTQRALINSPLAITLAWAGYLGFFVWMDARNRTNGVVARAHALQLTFVALLAFAPVSRGALESAVELSQAANLRWLLLVLAAAAVIKIGAWLYLFSLFALYYLASKEDVFTQIFSVFPSVHREAHRYRPLREQRRAATAAGTSAEQPASSSGGNASS